MVLLFEPLKVFMPPSALVLLVAAGKLVFDLFGKDFRVAGNTIVLLGVGLGLGSSAC